MQGAHVLLAAETEAMLFVAELAVEVVLNEVHIVPEVQRVAGDPFGEIAPEALEVVPARAVCAERSVMRGVALGPVGDRVGQESAEEEALVVGDPAAFSQELSEYIMHGALGHRVPPPSLRCSQYRKKRAACQRARGGKGKNKACKAEKDVLIYKSSSEG